RSWGTSGPVHVSFGGQAGWYTPFNKAWPKAFEVLNQPSIGDPLSGESSGPFQNPGTIHGQTRQRSHAGVAYYNDEVAKRPNLRVVTEVMVEKVLFEKGDDSSITATGVLATTADGIKRTIPAAREVILAAGALNTPKILELSGIGDARLLQPLGIDVLVNNPNVGENFQDHGFVAFSWEVAGPQSSSDCVREPDVRDALMQLYQNGGAGPLGVQSLASSFLPVPDVGELDALLHRYLDDDEKSYNKQFPAKQRQYELLRELLLKPGEPSSQTTFAPFQISPQRGPSLKKIFGMQEPGEYVSIATALNYPFSRGSVHIQSADPQQKPGLDLGLLSHPLDLELHARQVLWAEKIAQTGPFAVLLKKDGRRLHLPTSTSTSTSTSTPIDLETAKKLTTERILPHYHASGTCAMMPRELGGVVDDRLTVYGTTNVRVVDASVFPLIPRGNIQTDVYAVAEGAADIIAQQ
ncbi:Aryl-alcohol dehydrogenase, partial [Rasamsonia emersonii CBS 393.64]